MSPHPPKAARLLPFAVLLCLLLLSACDGSSLTGTLAETEPPEAPTLPGSASKQDNDVIPGRYIVVFHEDLADVRGRAQDLTNLHAGALHLTFETAIKGFAASLTGQAVEALRRNPSVAYVEPDRYVYALGDQNAPPSWGLDRIDQRNLPFNYNYHFDHTGAGVTVYILDTGIDYNHPEFGGRASFGYDAVDPLNGNGQDCHGHGTHVAGTAGSSTYGVAKNVALVSVRVIDCDGTGRTSGVIAGVDWVTQHASGPSVANMSVGSNLNQALNDAVERSIAAGVTYAVAAGNANDNACSYSPASAPSALTVGSTTNFDSRSSFSSYGTCVDLFAPGSSIKSTVPGGGAATWSGTSMATPHVAGTAALYLEAYPGAAPSAVAGAILNQATAGVISNTGSGSPNRLLYSLFPNTPPPPNNPPAADFSHSATNLAAAFTDRSSDADGTVVAWRWSFGDGSTSTARHPSHTYGSTGTYTVTLSVTDDDGATGTAVRQVTVSAPSPGAILLSALGYKKKNRHHIDLSWSGAGSSSVDIYRNGARIATTANDGAYTDATGNRGSGSYVHRVCEAGTATCSNAVTTNF